MLQAVGFFRVKSGLTQAVRSLVELAADHVIRDRYKTTKVPRVPGPLASQPLAGLPLAPDPTGAVGSCKTPFPFESQIEHVGVNVVMENQ